MVIESGLKFLCVFVLACAATLPDGQQRQQATKPSLLLTPDAPEMNRRAPDLFKVRFETSKGVMLIEMHRDWSPQGVDHFYNLVAAGYYDGVRFSRVVKGK